VHALWGAGLGGVSTHFFTHLKNEFFSRNLGHMPKNEYFLEKSCKVTAAQGAPPQIPVGLRRLGTPPLTPRVITVTY